MLAGHGRSAMVRMRRLVGRSGLWVCTGVAIMLAGAACFETPADVVLSTIDGSVILLEDTDPILNDATLSEAAKRQQLSDLGVPDDVVDTLLRAS